MRKRFGTSQETLAERSVIFPLGLNMEGGVFDSVWKMPYPYRIFAVIIGIIGFFLASRSDAYQIGNLTPSQIGILGLALLVVAVYLFFRQDQFHL